MYIEEELERKVQNLLQNMPQNLGHALGIEFQYYSKNEVKATMPVDENTIQPFGILHGGASVALAESLVSIGAWLNIDEESKAAVGVEINANHIRSMKSGTSVIGTGHPIHLGRKTHVWEAKIRNPANDKLVCVSRCTVAIVNKTP